MGEKITKDNIDEYITSYIDGEISDSAVKKEVNSILSNDETLQKKYNAELLTKNFLRSMTLEQDVPLTVLNRIKNSIDDVIASASLKSSKEPSETEDHPIYTSSSFFDYIRIIIASPVRVGKFGVPRYAFAIVLILIVISGGLLMNQRKPIQLNPFIADGSDKSIMVQAMNNFHKILKGEIKAQINSSDAGQVKDYLKNNVDYEVYIPCIENCELVGAVCNEYNGQKIAHIIYHSGDDIFYICETSSKCLNRRVMEIPEPVHNEIMTHKFYMCDKVDKENDCTMLVWYTGNVICTSVSTMPRQKMYAAFTNFK